MEHSHPPPYPSLIQPSNHPPSFPSPVLESPIIVTHQKLFVDIDFNLRSINATTELKITNLKKDFLSLYARQIVIKSILINGISVEYSHSQDYKLESLWNREKDHLSLSPPNYHYRMKEHLKKHYEIPELTINLPKEWKEKGEEGGREAISYPSEIVLIIKYELVNPEASVHFYHFPHSTSFPISNSTSPSIPPPSSNTFHYYQLQALSEEDCMARYWIPCIENSSPSWSFEYKIKIPEGTSPDSLHLVSTGVMIRQYYDDHSRTKTLSFSMDLAIRPDKVAFASGTFISNKVPSAPQAYMFVPAKTPSSLVLPSMDYLSKVFGYCNWYLNGGGNANNANGINANNAAGTGQIFPFPSFYCVFAREACKPVHIGANICIISSTFLHDATITEQAFITREAISLALCEQYFGIRLRADKWLSLGIRNHIARQMMRIFNGNNDYIYNLKMEMESVISIERKNKMPSLLEASSFSSFSTFIIPSSGSNDSAFCFLFEEWLNKKSRLVIMLLERLLEPSSWQKVLATIWNLNLEGKISPSSSSLDSLNTEYFVKIAQRMTGKDLKAFSEQWIYSSGSLEIRTNFSLNKKKGIIEMNIYQNILSGNRKFMGTLLVRVHEVDGTFDHQVHIDDNLHHVELPFHSKSKKSRGSASASSSSNRKGAGSGGRDSQMQVPLPASESDEEPPIDIGTIPTAEAIMINDLMGGGGGDGDEDLGASNSLSSELSQILWIRIDPEMDWIASHHLEQPDFMWIEQLESDRNVLAQMEAIQSLCSYSSDNAIKALERVIVNSHLFYKVRINAIEALALLSPLRLLEIFSRRYGLQLGIVGASGSNSGIASGSNSGNNISNLPTSGSTSFTFGSNSPSSMIKFKSHSSGIGVNNPNNPDLTGKDKGSSMILAKGGNVGNGSNPIGMGVAMGGDPFIPRPNNFENLSSYFIQKAIPWALRSSSSPQVVQFLTDLLMFNDNSTNIQSDCYYLGTILRAIGIILKAHPNLITEELMNQLYRYQKLEFIRPFYHNQVMVSSLEALIAINEFEISIRNKLYGLDILTGINNYDEIRLTLSTLLPNKELAIGNHWYKKRFILKENQLSKEEIWSLMSTSDDSLSFLWLEKCCKLYEIAPEDSILLQSKVLKEEEKEMKSRQEEMGESLNKEIEGGGMGTGPILKLKLGAGGERGEFIQDDREGSLSNERIVDGRIMKMSIDNEEFHSNYSAIHPPSQTAEDWFTEVTGESIGMSTFAHHSHHNHNHVTKKKKKIITASGSIHPPSLSERLISIWQMIWENFDSYAFRYPVDPSVPGYYTIIKMPIDLALIKNRINEGYYGKLEDFCLDMRRMFENCFVFNQPNSMIYDQAKRLRQFSMKKLKSLFSGEAAMIKEHFTAEDPIVAPLPPPSTRLSFTLEESSDSIAKSHRLLEELSSHKYAYWFAQPIDPVALGIPHYFKIVKNPMDLSTVRLKLQDDVYCQMNSQSSPMEKNENNPANQENENRDTFDNSMNSLFYDIQLIFDNCQIFNPVHTLVHQNGLEMQAYFHSLWKRYFGELPPKERDMKSLPSSSLKLKIIKTKQMMMDIEKETEESIEKNVMGESIFPVPIVIPSFQSATAPVGSSKLVLKFDANTASIPSLPASNSSSIASTTNTSLTLKTFVNPAGGKSGSSKTISSVTCTKSLMRSDQQKNWKSHAQIIMDNLMTHQFAPPFLEPVDPISLNIPHYPEVISCPMDFGTINSKLKQNQYDDWNGFYKDIKLVFVNCYTFNGKKAQISLAAKVLEGYFEKLYKKYK